MSLLQIQMTVLKLSTYPSSEEVVGGFLYGAGSLKKIVLLGWDQMIPKGKLKGRFNQWEEAPKDKGIRNSGNKSLRIFKTRCLLRNAL